MNGRERMEGEGATGRLGDWETGRLGDWETGRLGDWETGRRGDGETGGRGDWETGRLGDWGDWGEGERARGTERGVTAKDAKKGRGMRPIGRIGLIDRSSR